MIRASLSRALPALLASAVTLLAPAAALAWEQTQTCTRGGGAFPCGINEIPRPVHWGRRCVTYGINDQGSPELPSSNGAIDPTLKAAIDASFDAWTQVSCSNALLVPAGVVPDTYIGYEEDKGRANVNLVIWKTSEWAHSRSAYAVTITTFDPTTGLLADADIELNSVSHTFTVTDNPALTRVDVQNTLTHEVGHLLGLDHSNVTEATMYAEAAQSGELKKRTLASDDTEALCTLYPIDSGRLSCLTSLPYTSSVEDATLGSPGYPAEGCRHSSFPASAAPNLPLCVNDEGVPADRLPADEDEGCLGCASTPAPALPAPALALGALGALLLRRRRGARA